MRRVSVEFETLVQPDWRIRKINLTANNIVAEDMVEEENGVLMQVDLFGEYLQNLRQREQEKRLEKRERRAQKAVIDIKRRYGKNSILRAIDFEEGATARERNREVGGHRA